MARWVDLLAALQSSFSASIFRKQKRPEETCNDQENLRRKGPRSSGQCVHQPDRKVPKKSTPGQGRIKGTTLRTKSSINRLNMYRGGHAIRNKKGRIVHGGAYNDKNSTGGKIVKNMGSAVARTAPNRRWFGNTRIINPKQLDKFREEMGAKVNDPYTVVLRTRKLPMGLLSTRRRPRK